MAEYQIEMHWLCSSCGARNLGRHVACTGCGNPKDASEEYLMPEDLERAEAVRDAKLLEMAKAGENWACKYCKSHQRRLDGACAHCGARQDDGESVTAEEARRAPAALAPAQPAKRGSRLSRYATAVAIMLSIVFGLIAVIVVAIAIDISNDVAVATKLAPSVDRRPRYAVGTVTGLRWEHVVVVERKEDVLKEGFADKVPPDARAVQTIGQKQHHTERVIDGYTTETYSVREQDGTETERYTERVKCGEDCSTTSRSCTKKCTSNKNGFATCNDVCTGGDRRCSPRYCNESRTRQVPRYRNVTKTRQVPRWIDRPVMMAWQSYRVWEWRPNRTLREQGEGKETKWPAADAVALGKKLAPGEEEREKRNATYAAVVTWAGESAGIASLPMSVPLATEAELASTPAPGRILVRSGAGSRPLAFAAP